MTFMKICSCFENPATLGSIYHIDCTLWASGTPKKNVSKNWTIVYWNEQFQLMFWFNQRILYTYFRCMSMASSLQQTTDAATADSFSSYGPYTPRGGGEGYMNTL